eukprot:1685314-Pyramimonas_sp.AAC.1
MKGGCRRGRCNGPPGGPPRGGDGGGALPDRVPGTAPYWNDAGKTEKVNVGPIPDAASYRKRGRGAVRRVA